MIVPLLLLAALSPAPEIETAAARTVTEQFERVGRTNPQIDPVLSRAARILAGRAADGEITDATEQLALTAAISEGGGADPTPKVLVLRSTDPLFGLAKRDDLSADPCTHLGVGAMRRGEKVALVFLFADRHLQLAPLARMFARPPPPQKLCMHLLAPLKTAELFVTRPQGLVDRYPTHDEKGSLCATFELPTLGRHTVEVLGVGDRGPQVAALFFVQIGATASKDAPQADREPTTNEETRGRVLLKINALRTANGAQALARDFELDSVAQAYAERMAKENFFAHISPDGDDLKGRLQRAGYRYSGAGENLGLANGPLSAHFSIEHSPGHRKNLLESGYTRAGIGSARNSLNQVVLVEVLATPTLARANEDPVVEALQAITEARRLKGLPALARSTVLDQLAATHARRALELDTPKSKLPGENLHDRIFATRDDLKSTSVDFFVTESPSLVVDSKNLFDPRATLVGIGVARGDSPTYGAAKFWIVVIYASTLASAND